jgi:hypothetical protein
MVGMMAQTPTDRGTAQHTVGEHGRFDSPARPGEQPAASGHRSRFPRTSISWCWPVAGLLTVGLVVGLLISVGWLRPADLAVQVLGQLVVLAGAAVAAAMVRLRSPR